MAETVVLIVDDLMFLPKLESNLLALGYQPITATNDADLSRALFTAPVLAIVDLFSHGFDWEALVRLIKGPGKKAAHVPVLGFGPHVDLDLRQRALAAGCTAVVGRSAIVSQLPQLVNKHKWAIDRNRCQDTPPPLLREGIDLFNRGEFYMCHEVIEDAWMEEPSPIRIMYQGILQVGVACYHIQNKNWRGAVKVLERGVPKLGRFSPACMGIDIARLLEDAAAIRQELVRLGPEWRGEFDCHLFPTIKFLE
jgi:predicted metal-dependent hydrolase